MALNFAEVPSGGGGFFKPKDNFDTKALLIEVRKYDPSRESGDYGPKPAIYADVTYFKTDEALEKGEPDDVVNGQIIQGTALVRDLEGLVGNATIVTLTQLEGKGGRQGAYVWRNVPKAVRDKVIAYAEKREAAVKEAQESGDLPSFLS